MMFVAIIYHASYAPQHMHETTHAIIGMEPGLWAQDEDDNITLSQRANVARASVSYSTMPCHAHSVGVWVLKRLERRGGGVGLHAQQRG